MPSVTLQQAFLLAQQHHQAGRLAEAESVYRQILAVAPQHADALNFLGIIASQTGRHDLAIGLMRQSIAIHPSNAAYHDNLGTALRESGRTDEAIACSRQALALGPDEPVTHHNLGNALQDKGLLTEAIASYQHALALAPNYADVYLGLGRALVDLGLASEADATYRQALALDPTLVAAHSALLLNLHYLDDVPPAVMLAEHRRWARVHTPSLRLDREPHTNDPTPGRRLRIGYVSPDFRNHPVAFFIESLLANHHRKTIEVFCYSNTRRPDGVTARLRHYAQHWRDITALTDLQAATLIREDRIDILVDLAGHTADHRLQIFARKPAPVQVTYLGYCDTTGLDAIDYRITDAQADPPGLSEPAGTEQLVRLPDCFVCFRPSELAPPVGPLPARQCGHITFASFHTLAKLSDRVLEWWAQILTHTPGARLQFAASGLSDHAAQERLQTFFTARGVTAERLEFRPWQSLQEYLAMHNAVDVLLDSHPFSGHTASCHALWMGVPVVTLAGQRHCERMVASALHSVGLRELIAQTPEEYIQIARPLAADLPRLAALRATLRDRTAASPLMDAPAFARAMEAAYRRMWQTWCAQRS